MFSLDLFKLDRAVGCIFLLLLFLALYKTGKGSLHNAGLLLNQLLSCFLDTYLRWRFPINATDGSTRAIPTCPYRWPNGQGDVGKFLEGSKNSAEWRKRFGGVYRLWAGMNQEIVLTRPEDIKSVFRDSNHHAKAVANDSGYLMHQLLGDCLGLINHESWRAVREATEHAFLAPSSASHIPLLKRRTQEYFAELESRPDSNLARDLIDPVEDLKLLPFRIVAEVVYGELDSSARDALESLVPLRERLWKRMIEGGLTRYRWSRFLPLAVNGELQRWRQQWSDFNDRMSVLARDKEQLCDRSPPIVTMYAAVENQVISRSQALQTLDEMLFANLDVTMGGLSWNLVFLAENPSAQAQISAELLSQHQEWNPNMKHDEAIASEVSHSYLVSSHTFLHNCILESARLRPLAAFSVPQSAPDTRIIGGGSKPGYVIPGGTNYIIDTHALNIHNTFWGAEQKERESYRPARFQERKSVELRYNYWRYGFGPRQCLGKHVADLIIKHLLVYLVSTYELSLQKEHDGSNICLDSGSWITHPRVHLVCMRIKPQKWYVEV